MRKRVKARAGLFIKEGKSIKEGDNSGGVCKARGKKTPWEGFGERGSGGGARI